VVKFGENRPLQVAERSRGLPNKKKSRSAGLVPAPILPKMGRSRSKFCERFGEREREFRSHLDMSMYTKFGSDRLQAFCRTYSGKIGFSAQKVNTIIGF